jgi:hypothetical protein
MAHKFVSDTDPGSHRGLCAAPRDALAPYDGAAMIQQCAACDTVLGARFDRCPICRSEPLRPIQSACALPWQSGIHTD